MNHTCPICELPATVSAVAGADQIEVLCTNCGGFRLSATAAAMLSGLFVEPKRRYLVAHFIRRVADSRKLPIISSDYLKNVVDTEKFPDAFQQYENLIVWLGSNLEYAGHTVPITFQNFQAIIGAAGQDGYSWVAKQASVRGLIEGIESRSMGVPFTMINATLTLEGWDAYHAFTKSTRRSTTAFMAMKFDDHALGVLVTNHFRPAVAATGFDLRRLDDEQPAGLIDDQMRTRIRTSRFLVCDLTHDNRGAYWESGFAEGLGLPVIYTCEKSKFDLVSTHFDTNHLVTVPWDVNNSHEAVRLLKATIRATFPEDAVLED